MKITTYILVFVIGVFGCFQSQTKIDIPIKERIIGNWKTEYFKGDWKETAFIFTFQDSTCSYLRPWGEYSKYWINGDTLSIKERIRKRRENVNGGKRIYKFLLDSITSETLFLQPITDETKELLKYSKVQNFDRIHLSKIKKQYDWKIERIGKDKIRN